MRLAAYLAGELRTHGKAFMSAKGREAALANFNHDWPHIELGFGRMSQACAVDRRAARICVDFLNHEGLWLLDIHRPATERIPWLEFPRQTAPPLGDRTSIWVIP